MNRTTNNGRRTWVTTTTYTLMLRNGEHKHAATRPGETLERIAAAAHRQYGDQLVRLAYNSTEICRETGEVADTTTGWFTNNELLEAADRQARLGNIW